MLRRAVWDHRRASAMDHPIHRRCSHEHGGNMADVSSMCLHATCLTFTLPNVRRLLCAARRRSVIYRRLFFAPKHREKISMHALKLPSISRCLGEAWRLLAYVADHLPNYWRMVALPLR